jgi:hypothetical protein
MEARTITVHINGLAPITVDLPKTIVNQAKVGD